MFKFGIKNRVIFSFITLITLALIGLISYLLYFFSQQNLKLQTEHLVTNGKIIEGFMESYLISGNQQQLDTELKKFNPMNNLRITIINPNGNVMADSWETPTNMDNHANRVEFQEALTASYATALRYSNTIEKNMLYVALPVYNNNQIIAIVRIAETLRPIETAFDNIRSNIIGAMFFTILCSFILSFWLGKKYTTPIEEITLAAKNIINGNLQQKIHLNTGDELEILALTLNKLTSGLQEKINETNAEAQKLALILEQMDNAIILLDQYGNVTSINKKAREIFNITAEMLGKHSISVLGNTLLGQTAHEVFASGQNKLITTTISINNTKKTFQVFFAPLSQHTVSPDKILTVFHDITVIQEIYERQVDFVANASNELATPLTAIKGFSETLLDGAYKDEALCEKFLKIIYTEAERMSRLLKDLLQLAKLDSAEYREQINLQPINLLEIFTEIKKRLHQQIAEKKQQLIINTCCQNSVIMANHDWVMQIIINLVENSIKYTPENGLITLQYECTEDFACITVSDNGIGISPEDLPHIFDRFYRVDKARTRIAGGSGLGLSLVKFIVELLGGQITVQSKVNQGTTITFSIPLAQ